MSGSWEAMLDDEERIQREAERQSRLDRRRQLARMSKVDLIDLVLLHERVNDEHEPTCVCITCGLLHDAPTEHEIRRQS